MERPKRLQRPLKSFAAVILIAGASLAMAWAADEKTPEGRAVLLRMTDYLVKSGASSVTVHTAYDAVQRDGFKVEWNDIRKVTLRRPDRLRVENERRDGASSLVLFDGNTITSFDEWGRVDAQASHPADCR
jgi:hypothetical protein